MTAFDRSDRLLQDSSRWFRGSVRMLIMLVMALLFELTFFMQILSETGVKVTFEFGLTVIPVPVIDMFL